MNHLSILLVIFAALIVSACSSNPDKHDPFPVERPRGIGTSGDNLNPLAERQREQRLSQIEASQFYWRARQRLDASDYATAIENYDELSTRHPFSEFTTQGELERIYALYRSFDYERSLSSAERFLREHPRHASVDYIHYVKGLINFSRDDSALNFLPIDDSKGDVSGHRRAFDEFSLLVQRYPNSAYAGDAYQRMVYIRNRLAAHELHVVDYYVRRGAYVAASNRAEQVVARYPGTPASYRALHMLVTCYELAGLDQQAKDARALVAAQDPVLMAAARDAEIANLSTSVTLDDSVEAQAPSNKGMLDKMLGLFGDDDDAPAKDENESDPVAELLNQTQTAPEEDPQAEDIADAINDAGATGADAIADESSTAESVSRSAETSLEQAAEANSDADANAPAGEPAAAAAAIADETEIDLDSYRAKYDDDGYQIIKLKASQELDSVSGALGKEPAVREPAAGASAENTGEAMIEDETGMKLDTSFSTPAQE